MVKVFSCVKPRSWVLCVDSFRLDLACLVSQRRVLCCLILCWLAWLIFFELSTPLALAIFCFASLFCLLVCLVACLCFSVLVSLVSTWFEFCVMRAFVFVYVVCRGACFCSSRQFSLSFCCGHWFHLLRHLCATLLYESPRRKPG